MQALTRLFERHGKSVQLAADDVIFSRGTELKQVFRLNSGMVMLHSSSFAGREVGFNILQAGDLFGIVPALQASVAGVDATALSACELLAIDRESFTEALLGDAALMQEVLHIVVARLALRTKQAEELALYAVRGRLARYVISLAHQQNGRVHARARIRLAFSQKIMAAMAGVSRETLNRQFRTWIEADIIALDGKELLILKPDELMAFAGASHV